MCTNANVLQIENHALCWQELTAAGCWTVGLTWPMYLGVNVDWMSKPTTQTEQDGAKKDSYYLVCNLYITFKNRGFSRKHAVYRNVAAIIRQLANPGLSGIWPLNTVCIRHSRDRQTPVLADPVKSKHLVAWLSFGDLDSATPHTTVSEQLTVTVRIIHITTVN